MTLHVTIIGGGASGTLAAAHLLQRRITPQRLRITIVEARKDVGCGIAYSTDQSSHLLNTRVNNMSAFPDDPSHFSRWLERQGLGSGNDLDFVPRRTYGRYLADLVAPEADAVSVPRLRILHQECVALHVHEHGVEVGLADGSVLPSHFAILATGFCGDDRRTSSLENPWARPLDRDPAEPVVLVGTGLTMIDMVLSLLEAGQTGTIQAISRRGLLPQSHKVTKPLKLSVADIPIGSSLGYMLHWLRTTIRAHEAAGGDWRDVIDGLRPHTQLLWRHLPPESRRRFLRHASTIWDTHRHRMPPSSAARIAEAQASGLLRIVKGHFQRAERTASGTTVTYRPSGSEGSLTPEGSHAIDCRGFRRISLPTPNRLLQSLLDNGTARLDPLTLGLDFDHRDALIDNEGQSSPRIFGVGPVTRGTHFEITAVPDIRVQAARLAELLLGSPGLSVSATA
ncbi:FAD-dependent pyridine nucleotide-disulfide oxidoreductase [Pseudorhizobium endolithicum]|uniref:FAD-dependent pyridine nucleotide-disulfide oxidoreductase n=1 Tax=Pseudorhizobium endolithicum TaxID=1191678 RepID=A0ABM8PY67_9HYPH|nr:FAD/NAD(P)-binding protein [Pseudorhizobium endolithicum]CAD7054462.1 FAD-dependent pyridine nucleotide-disulfide oxidoreductase [Pseudorhizobium endolithicum]